MVPYITIAGYFMRLVLFQTFLWLTHSLTDSLTGAISRGACAPKNEDDLKNEENLKNQRNRNNQDNPIKDDNSQNEEDSKCKMVYHIQPWNILFCAIYFRKKQTT